MERFTRCTGVGVPLRASNVDTDQILPSKHLKRITRSGFEDALFAAWREDAEFVLNRPEYSGGNILVTGPDFGTGSSREPAVWALQDYGFRVVIAPRFGDIFRTNAGNSGLLALTLPEPVVDRILDLLDARPGTEMTVDLEANALQCVDLSTSFEIDGYTRWRLLNGLDDIAITLSSFDAITEYEALRPPALDDEAANVTAPRTIIEKIWEEHRIARGPQLPDLLYVDLQFVHEVSSPQAFDGLRLTGRRVHRPDLTVATEDHNVPTDTTELREPVSRAQVEALRLNCEEFGVTLHRIGTAGQGIVHVIGPETGLTQPGMTIVCGDSHTSTHGALGALAFGIGTSEVEHVLATQTLPQQRPKTMAVTVNGELPAGVSSKDLALALIAAVGTGGGQGYVVEYRGAAIRALSIEARMSLCNMTIEWGARAGLVAPDSTTLAYLNGRPYAPTGAGWEEASARWLMLASDEGAVFDREVVLDASVIEPFVTWGTNPAQGVPLGAAVPAPGDFGDAAGRSAAERALAYMDLEPGTPMRAILIDTVFIGSCTNSRIEDLRTAAAVLNGRSIADGTSLLVVPGSMAVKRQAEAEGLDRIFQAAGAEWRGAGCSMCLGMNPDVVAPGRRTASTSNRNFEGRQGPGARTHLVSPAVAAATAVRGRLASPVDLDPVRSTA